MADFWNTRFRWSDEVLVYLNIRQLRFVAAVDYEGENLLAHAQIRLLNKKRNEMRGHVDRLLALPFLELDDDELRNENVQPVTDAKASTKAKGREAGWGLDDYWGSQTDDEDNRGWGAGDWFGSSQRTDDHSHCGSENDTESPTSFVPISDTWDQSNMTRQTRKEIASIIARLEWKFPRAFERNEGTVAHTEQAMQPFIEAADFLLEQTRRYRIKWHMRQRGRHMRMTRVRYTTEKQQIKSLEIDWDHVLKEYHDRLVKRKTYKQSPLSKDY